MTDASYHLDQNIRNYSIVYLITTSVSKVDNRYFLLNVSLEQIKETKIFSDTVVG